MNIPRATYRVQFHERFRLLDALALVPYLHELGISHLYASPLFAACPHSTHGYDVCDFSRLNPELGSESDLEKLVQALHKNKMGLVLDIVPNHMGIATPQNVWWWDVLKHGRASPYAGHFDIDWESLDPKLRGKIVLPVLGEKYEQVLAKGGLTITRYGQEPLLHYYENAFPVAPGSMPANLDINEINASPVVLDQLIQRQNYRLEFYGADGPLLNYRRFFAVNTLAGVRVEDKNVFAGVHSLLHRWLAKGWLDGLRVDHPDGLRDPGKYLRQLEQLAPGRWIVVEKILMAGEALPAVWPVAGTTGYDFLNYVNGLFIDPSGEATLDHFYSEFTSDTLDYAALTHEKKLLVLKDLFPAECNRLVSLLTTIAQKRKQNFETEKLSSALNELMAALAVYRTYLPEERNQAVILIEKGLAKAQLRHPEWPSALFDFLKAVLLSERPDDMENEFIARFQQLTGPAMAKGVEDTAFYCFNRLVSLNEVGGNPGQFGINTAVFHQFCSDQQNRWPNTMLTTSTHDTKRSEDVRARLNLLSEMPDLWTQAVRRWSARNAGHKRGEWPDRNTEYLFYQTLVGAWPLSSGRVLACMEKSVREAGQQTTWARKNSQYEAALSNFIAEALRDPEFVRDMERFVASLTEAGYINSLAQTLIKLTAPGVPDIYQGCELWDFSLVDPDNRRPVDFESRQRLLAEAKKLPVEQIWARHEEGLPKLWMISTTLGLRSRRKRCFGGEYRPMYAHGQKAWHVVAFMRGGGVITVVPRWTLKSNDWGDTLLELPDGFWRNEFTGENLTGTAEITTLFKKFPVALLVGKEYVS
ncbi:MAG TPA: malto-oligosyltrehalose synthase [Candidatus Sulfotelmatobacter sp.]|jgi:(1->4)-alpha-D-glucan 1-alpha-D-glucosylmutase|nr:malto-oligosyltrehalose synthase [Candidatus Sulfotelmatobacter sp.]